MRIACMWGLALLFTGCANQPAVLSQESKQVGTAQEPSGAPEPLREHHVVWTETGQKAEEGWIVDGQRHGPWKTCYSTGRTRWEGEYEHGKPVGVWRYWKENGLPEYQSFFVDGELSMVRRFTGVQMRTEEHYVDGVREGEWTSINSKGVITNRYYSNGASVSDPWQSQTIDALGYRLKHAPDPDVRVQAAVDMAQHGPESWNVIPDLISGLSDPDVQSSRSTRTGRWRRPRRRRCGTSQKTTGSFGTWERGESDPARCSSPGSSSLVHRSSP